MAHLMHLLIYLNLSNLTHKTYIKKNIYLKFVLSFSSYPGNVVFIQDLEGNNGQIGYIYIALLGHCR